MNATQLERWRTLALALSANASGFADALTPSDHQQLREDITDFIDGLDEVDAIDDWDSGRVGDSMSTYLRDSGYEYEADDDDGGGDPITTPHGSALTACVRAAFDVAVRPSGGVIGFSLGDLRGCFPDRVLPDWVQAFFESPIPADASDGDGLWL